MKKRGSIKIVIEDGNIQFVEMQLVNSDLWLASYELARLFNCFNQKIEMNLRSIFKSCLLREEDVSFTYRYTEKGIEKQIVYYNLEVLIFLSYRIGTFEAQIFRQFLKTALQEHLERKKTPKSTKLLWYFQSNQGNQIYPLN